MLWNLYSNTSGLNLLITAFALPSIAVVEIPRALKTASEEEGEGEELEEGAEAAEGAEAPEGGAAEETPAAEE